MAGAITGAAGQPALTPSASKATLPLITLLILIS